MIIITPENPITTDSNKLYVEGYGCIQKAELIDNNPIFIAKITKSVQCWGVPTPYGYDFEIGTLASGQYTIIHQLNDYLGNEESTEQVTINVSQAANPPATAVPSVSFLGLAMLTTLLLATGKYYFKKK